MKQKFDCHGDCSKCGDGVSTGVFYPPPEPGIRLVSCLHCYNIYSVPAGERGKCPICGYEEPSIGVTTGVFYPKTTYPQASPQKFWNVKTGVWQSPTSPQDELERAKKNVRRARGLDKPRTLSVGDLSFSAESKRKNRIQDGTQRLENMERGLSVGDLSFASAHKDPTELDGLYVGQGAYVAPSTSESQEVADEMMAKRQRDQEEIFRIRQIMFEQQQEKELKREARLKGVTW